MMFIRSTDRTPYTYLIGWSKHNIWYYGVRYAKGCHPTDLWITYFTSSDEVARYRDSHGDPDIREIRREFMESEVTKARRWEKRVLKLLKVVQRSDFLNKTDNESIPPMYGDDNPSKRPEVRGKIGLSVAKYYEDRPGPNTGNTWTEEEKQEWGQIRTGEGNPFHGHKHSAENLKLFSKRQKGENNSFYGMTHTDEHKQSVGDRFRGIPKATVCCIYCQKEVGINVFPRWHGDNCKKR